MLETENDGSTTNFIEIQPTKPIDKKTMRKRVKNFLKKLKPSSQLSLKTPSKLSQIQRVILKHQPKLDLIPNSDLVSNQWKILFSSICFSSFSQWVKKISIGGRSITRQKVIRINVEII